MVFQTILSLFPILLLLGVAALGLSRAEGSDYAHKTIKTEYGDIYDCVDFYKQPAFDHPLLKNHSFYPEMRPTSLPQRSRKSNFSWKINATETDMIRLKDGGCPQGMVPIKRLKKSSGLSGSKLYPQRSKAKNLNGATDYVSGTIFALSQTKGDPSKIYHGVGAIVTVYKPRVLESQYSSGEIIIKGGTDSIIAGWTANPNKYQDNQPRFFVYAVAGDMRCFNTECGFVQTRSDIPLDFVMSPVSKRGGPIYGDKFFIHRDVNSGHWWLQIGMKEPAVTMGFWPHNIFSGLQQPATYAACGGEIYTTETLPPPEMGAGWYPFPTGDDAYCTDFVVVDDRQTVVDAGDTETYANNNNYGVIDQHFGHHKVLFGGPM